MKRIPGLIAVLAVFSLVACSSGGGGGGGTAPGAAIKQPSAAVMFPGASVANSGVDPKTDGGSNIPASSTNNDTKIGDANLAINTSGSFVLYKADDPGTVYFTVTNDAINRLDNGYLITELAPPSPDDPAFDGFMDAMHEVQPDLPPAGNNVTFTEEDGDTFTGNVTYGKQTLTLAGENVAGFTSGDVTVNGITLAHSTFGAWAMDYEGNGTLAKQDGGTQTIDEKGVFYAPIFGGDTAKHADPEAREYSGPAMAMAAEYYGDGTKYRNEFLNGKASLTVAGANSVSSISLEFPGFYDFNYTTGGGAGFAVSNGSMHIGTNSEKDDPKGLTFREHGHTSDIHLKEVGGHKLDAQFYGDGGPATEGVGSFEINGKNMTDHDVIISGAFGVN